MATLSRRTLGIAIECLERWTQPQIEILLYRLDIPNALIKGASKRMILLNLFRSLEDQQREDLQLKILLEALPKLNWNDQSLLKDALIKDGFVFDNGEITKDVPVAEKNRSSLELLLNRHSADLNTKTLSHHLKENIDLFRQEKWDSSISHAKLSVKSF